MGDPLHRQDFSKEQMMETLAELSTKDKLVYTLVKQKFDERIEKAGPEFLSRLEVFRNAKKDFNLAPGRLVKYHRNKTPDDKVNKDLGFEAERD
mmetsp:Transcript_8057/g.29760  ORF Transcript_8057/g.29760 Transcript_8057/m.29760 type:complete len:94 (+) Transcript_8057:104-385(+)